MRILDILCAIIFGIAVTGGVRAADSGQERAVEAGSALIGTEAPKLKLTSIDGQSIDLGDYYGKKAVYLKFWATWCVPCLQQMPHFEHAFESAGPDLVVIGVNTNFNETPAGVKEYRQKHGLKMPIVMDDGRLAAALNLRVTPQHVLIARDGRIAFVGHLADAPLDEALAGIQQPNSHVPKKSMVALRHAKARPMSVRTLAGGEFAFVDPTHARATVLVFISPWCESYLKDSRPEASKQCREARLQTEGLASGSDARFIAIASGLWANDVELKAYQSQNAIKLPLALDASGAVFRGYGVRQVPTVIVVGADGREIKRLTGDTGELAATLFAAHAKAGAGG
jgi:peroxiredoxin